MRGNLCDQDLTDYALNEVEPEVRLYLESMLAVSEECRHDVYDMLELGQMLEEGFEAEEDESPFCRLTPEQRDNVATFRQSVPMWHRAAIAVGLAACAAFVVSNPAVWQQEDPAGRVALVSEHMSRIVAEAVGPERLNFAAPLATIASFAEDTSNWMPVVAEVVDPMICTPPTWPETSAAMGAE